jgi:hypothetical protein
MAKRATRRHTRKATRTHTRKATRTHTRKTIKRHTLKGGYFPSVYGGVTGASMLAPLIARQALRMYNNTSVKRRRHTKKTLRKKKLQNFTRANA